MVFIIELQYLPRSASVADVRQYFGVLTIPEGGVFIVGGQNGNAFIRFKYVNSVLNKHFGAKDYIRGLFVAIVRESFSNSTERLTSEIV